MSPSTPRRRDGCIASAALWLTCAQAMAAQPAVGRYTGQWCVALPNADAACGPAQVQWRTGRAWVRISDIVYTLRLRTSQVDVALKQGATQIDDFSAIYEWDGATLRFVDAAKNVRYELQTQAPRNSQAAASAAAPR